jgi:hypothetical protein
LVEIIQTAPLLGSYWLIAFEHHLETLGYAELENLYRSVRTLLLSQNIGVKLASVLVKHINNFRSKDAILKDLIKERFFFILQDH